MYYPLCIHSIVHINFDVLDDTDPCYRIGKVIIRATAGEILSPNYPDLYPKEANCHWRIGVDDRSVIRLTFLQFDVEDGYDHILTFIVNHLSV